MRHREKRVSDWQHCLSYICGVAIATRVLFLGTHASTREQERVERERAIRSRSRRAALEREPRAKVVLLLLATAGFLKRRRGVIAYVYNVLYIHSPSVDCDFTRITSAFVHRDNTKTCISCSEDKRKERKEDRPSARRMYTLYLGVTQRSLFVLKTRTCRCLSRILGR